MIESKTMIGITVANNIGIKHSRGEYIAFLNDDVKVDQNWPFDLIIAMEKDKTIGVCAGTQFSYCNLDKITSCGFLIDRYGTGVDPFPKRATGPPREVFGVLTQHMLVRKSVLKETGYFDDLFYAWEDELDLCWRVRLAGYKCMYVPGGYVYHVGGVTIKRLRLAHNTYLIRRNRLRTLLKNYGRCSLLSVLPGYLSMETMAIVYYLLSGQLDMACALIRALNWNIRNLRSTLRQRYYVQRVMRKIQDIEIKKTTMVHDNITLQRMIRKLS